MGPPLSMALAVGLSVLWIAAVAFSAVMAERKRRLPSNGATRHMLGAAWGLLMASLVLPLLGDAHLELWQQEMWFLGCALAMVGLAFLFQVRARRRSAAQGLEVSA